MRKNRLLNLKGKLVSLENPLVMGILNVTPDSFFASSRQNSDSDIVARIETIISEGGAIVDVGGCSTRPDATNVTMEEEWGRLEPALDLLMKKYPDIPVSIDTFRAEIARRAVENYGVAIINDISGGTMDSEMFETVSALNVPYILTHFGSTTQSRETSIPHRSHPPTPLKGGIETSCVQDFREEVMLYFAEKLQVLRMLGLKDVILDPGFGFGKTLEQNYMMMSLLPDFSRFFDCPLLVGVSRKSMIYKLLDISAEDSLNGTTVLNTFSLLNGADILRVHDVKAAVEAVRLIGKIDR